MAFDSLISQFNWFLNGLSPRGTLMTKAVIHFSRIALRCAFHITKYRQNGDNPVTKIITPGPGMSWHFNFIRWDGICSCGLPVWSGGFLKDANQFCAILTAKCKMNCAASRYK